VREINCNARSTGKGQNKNKLSMFPSYASTQHNEM